MKSSDAVKQIEDALVAAGLSIFDVHGVRPAKMTDGDHPDVVGGHYRLVDLRVAVPDNG